MKWAFDEALKVAEELQHYFLPVVHRFQIAGSLRRIKDEVGDVEILYVPKTDDSQSYISTLDPYHHINARIDCLLRVGFLKKRPNKKGHFTWGKKNKLAVHHSGIPVDLFEATETNWWNYLVCRTGPAESNMRIAKAAIRKGWKWNPYGAGFTRGGAAGQREEYVVKSEADVFNFVGLPYLKPWERK